MKKNLLYLLILQIFIVSGLSGCSGCSNSNKNENPLEENTKIPSPTVSKIKTEAKKYKFKNYIP